MDSFRQTFQQIWDAYSGDYGPNFFGHALNTAVYVIDHPEFGWLVFGGNLEVDGQVFRVKPLDSFRRRLYIAPFGLWLTLDAGTFEIIRDMGLQVVSSADLVQEFQSKWRRDQIDSHRRAAEAVDQIKDKVNKCDS